jgi:hypothetical protein
MQPEAQRDCWTGSIAQAYSMSQLHQHWTRRCVSDNPRHSYCLASMCASGWLGTSTECGVRFLHFAGWQWQATRQFMSCLRATVESTFEVIGGCSVFLPLQNETCPYSLRVSTRLAAIVIGAQILFPNVSQSHLVLPAIYDLDHFSYIDVYLVVGLWLSYLYVHSQLRVWSKSHKGEYIYAHGVIWYKRESRCVLFCD